MYLSTDIPKPIGQGLSQLGFEKITTDNDTIETSNSCGHLNTQIYKLSAPRCCAQFYTSIHLPLENMIRAPFSAPSGGDCNNNCCDAATTTTFFFLRGHRVVAVDESCLLRVAHARQTFDYNLLTFFLVRTDAHGLDAIGFA